MIFITKVSSSDIVCPEFCLTKMTNNYKTDDSLTAVSSSASLCLSKCVDPIIVNACACVIKTF